MIKVSRGQKESRIWAEDTSVTKKLKKKFQGSKRTLSSLV